MKAFGLTYFGMTDRRQGIVHVIGPEEGFTVSDLSKSLQALPALTHNISFQASLAFAVIRTLPVCCQSFPYRCMHANAMQTCSSRRVRFPRLRYWNVRGRTRLGHPDSAAKEGEEHAGNR